MTTITGASSVLKERVGTENRAGFFGDAKTAESTPHFQCDVYFRDKNCLTSYNDHSHRQRYPSNVLGLEYNGTRS